MKQLKAKRLVKFDGHCSSWSDSTSHHRCLKTAKLLDESSLARFVRTTELAPTLEVTDERVKLEDRTYYTSDGPVLVDEAEFELLKKTGAKDLQVIGIYEDQSSSNSQILFYTAIGMGVFWSAILSIALLKVAGVF